jgi:hypothetical protein
MAHGIEPLALHELPVAHSMKDATSALLSARA